MIKIEKFIFNPFSENTYLVYDEESLDGLIIDPGCYSEDEEKMLSDFINKNCIKIKYLINTHCHIDHVLGNKFIKEKYNPVFLAPEKDMILLEKLYMQSEMVDLAVDESPKPDKFMDEGMEIFLGEEKFNFIETPGHTPGEYCIHYAKNKILFSGDVLFQDSIGRTDLWGGSYNQLINSIKNKLFLLEKETVVLPGHGDSTTIVNEMLNNDFLK